MGEFKNHVLHFRDIQDAFAYGGIEGVDGLVLELLENCSKSLVVKLHLPVLEASAKNLLTVSGFLELGFAKLLAYLGPGFGCHDYVQPV